MALLIPYHPKNEHGFHCQPGVLRQEAFLSVSQHGSICILQAELVLQ